MTLEEHHSVSDDTIPLSVITVVKNGEICIAPVLPVAATFDHRVVDGGHISRMVNGLNFYLIIQWKQ